jgi:transcriptional regulator with XRE-family HTH domain
MRLNPIDEYVGAQITRWRVHRGLEQKDLADRAGINSSIICRYESGESRAYAITLWKISKALGIPVSYFFEGLPVEATGAPDHEVTQ